MKALVLGVLGFCSLGLNALASQSSEEQYKSLFPLYMQYCAATQIKPVNGEAGGYGGHAVIYVEGLCKNENAEYPRVEACSRIPTQRHAHTGVGISVDKYFKNVNWVAVPDYDFFINGELSNKTKVTASQQMIAVTNAVMERNVFKGVLYDEKQIDRKLLDNDKIAKTRTYEWEMANQALGTDFALTWGRSLECVRLPITEPQLYAVRDYLNRLNEKYYQNPSKPFEWSAYYNNCAHTSSNAFAAIGVRKYIEPDSNFAWQVLNIANPANPLLTIKYKSQREAASLSDIESGGRFEKAFKEFKWVPTEAGALTVNHPILKNNELFLADVSAFKLPAKPLHLSYWINDFNDNESKTPRYTNLEQNLGMWVGRYKGAITKLKEESISPDNMALRDALMLHYKASLESTQGKLKQLTLKK